MCRQKRQGSPIEEPSSLEAPSEVAKEEPDARGNAKKIKRAKKEEGKEAKKDSEKAPPCRRESSRRQRPSRNGAEAAKLKSQPAPASGAGAPLHGVQGGVLTDEDTPISPEWARIIIHQAKGDGIHDGLVREDDTEAVEVASELVRNAEQAWWERKVRGSEVEAIVRYAAAARGQDTAHLYGRGGKLQ